jgi:protein SCO1
MTKKTRYYILFFSLLVIGFYFAIINLVPGFSEKGIQVIGNIQPFSFTNQDGKPVTQKDVAGKVFVVEYFFTTCQTICPKMNTNMKKVYEACRNEKDFLILSHTCDPKNDSAARLKQYADSLKVDTNRWIFLTGAKDSLYNMARFSYKIDDPKDNTVSVEEDFLHTQFFALVNKSGEVTAIYDGLKQKEIQSLITEIKKLTKE